MVAKKATTWKITKTEMIHVSPVRRRERDPKKLILLWLRVVSARSEVNGGGGGVGGGGGGGGGGGALISIWVWNLELEVVSSAIGILLNLFSLAMQESGFLRLEGNVFI
jgi:hypothetical protein